ncbi:MAG: methyltransferase domain-containing protein [Candidatus Binatia bacterium]|nr:methyltransferase domain-containing protein [Candidatus Binatia bacterium]
MSDPIVSDPSELAPHLVRRSDESDDRRFYQQPRLVTHVDDATIAALTKVYRDRIPAGASILDFMSSWISHLPSDIDYERVAGQGMNAVELGENPRLTDRLVHDLNAAPTLPYEDESFDFAISAFSAQYLTQPVTVFFSIAKKLRPAGTILVAVSHRVFPTKAIHAWQALPPSERPRLVEKCFEQAGRFTDIETTDHSPTGADPLWIVSARKA